MEPGDTESQARALLASRRILARMKLELVDRGEAAPGLFGEEDRELLRDDTQERLREDLRTFAEWHAALGTDPEAALLRMRRDLEGR
ncbi:hypothetical protein E0L93_11400 [Rubrobacter taiwanensis]|jgi:hypothetical protein|uniref:Uncharacterized protein n=1 Tax=Rubrobacter taiwanensis TaxID=185139 RepID=A0A4R1BFC6_9ACTN|nr:hypothetical protein [Rubrobacter taiwanensis]TCJ15859.1 hypothetical protein E0L93_11400 [Rubrobacter taiwanensis]